VNYPDNFDRLIGESVSPNGKLQTSLYQTCKEEDQTQNFIRSNISLQMNIENPKFINEYQCDPKVGHYICSKPEAISNFQNFGNKVDLVKVGSLHQFYVSGLGKGLVYHYFAPDGRNKLKVKYNNPIFKCPNNTFLTYIQMVPQFKQEKLFAVHDGGFSLQCSKPKENNIVKVLSHIGFSNPITPVATTDRESCPDNHYAIGIEYLEQKLDQIQDVWVYFTAPSIRLICQEIEVCSYFYNNVRSYLTFHLSKL
jgi:hypothetical protein